VLTGDGAFYMHGLEIHTAVEHELPITYVIFNNSAHGMCLVRERLLLREDAGYNAFRRSHIGAGLRAMFPGLSSVDCTTTEQVKAAFADSLQRKGPSVIVVELRDVEVPPFAAFQSPTGPVITKVSRGEGHEDD
jgi:acetolactate synthase-1/2/3 large subunit